MRPRAPVEALISDNRGRAVTKRVQPPGRGGVLTSVIVRYPLHLDALHATLVSRIEELLFSLLPEARPADVTRTAHVCFGMHTVGLEQVLAHEGAERDAYTEETENVLIRCLEPMVGDRLGNPGVTTTRA